MNNLLEWQEETKTQVWYDSKQKMWTAFLHRAGVVIQPTKPTLEEVLTEARRLYRERIKELICLSLP
jgi:hypothetical protein